MIIHIEEDKWSAEILFSPQSEMQEFMHATAKIAGETEEYALNGAQIVLDLFAKGRNTFVRVPPEANSDTNFDTKETAYLGYARFSFRLEAGSWNYATSTETSISTSLGKA